jgi:GntR family transcriptional regulator/MocR family aminotransferase
VLDLRGWAGDMIDQDDALLIEQLRTKLLPRRGIWVDKREIMITLGAQQAIYLLAELLTSENSVIGLEEPGYPDARNIFELKRRKLKLLPVDEDGLIPGDALAGCELVFATPNYQCPTTATMPLARREALLRQAEAQDFLIIEDDYEGGTSRAASTLPALKGMHRSQRVIYVGSLSKTLAPGLRLGYVVGPPGLIQEARALRRLMLRHPPANNQRAAALFLALGYHSAYLRRLGQILEERAAAASDALARHLPDFTWRGDAGGTCFWVEGPPTS